MSTEIKKFIPPEKGLQKEEAIALVERVAQLNDSCPTQMGALVDFRGENNSQQELLFVGDLHSRYDNLEKILLHNDNLSKIAKGKAVLIILGDAVHGELKKKAC